MIKRNHNINDKRVSAFTYPFIIIGFFLCSLLHAQELEIPTISEKAYKLALSLKLDNCESLIDSSNLPFDIYIKHYSKAIRAMANDEKNLFKAFENYHDDAYDMISDMDKNSPYRAFYLAEMLLQSTIVRLKYKEEWSAILSMRKAYSHIILNTEKYPKFLPNRKTFGLLHVIIGSVPIKYQWALSFLGFDGEVQQGVNELSELAYSDNLFSTEGKLLLALIQSYILQNTDEAVKTVQPVYEKHENNLLFGYLYASLLIKNSESDKALYVINSALSYKTDEHETLAILEYLKAEVLLQKGNYSSSISWYNHFIKNQSGENFIKDSYYKIAMNYLLLGKKERTMEYLELTQNNGSTYSDIDKYAHKQSQNKELPNPSILQMRYAFDGGYYEQVDKIIEKVGDFTFATKKDEVEFNYRKARFYHKTDKTAMAIALYKVTINSVSNEGWYFAPNSALQLGYIYKLQDDKESAKKYFELAMSYKNYEYKYSIDNKAKSGLESLNSNHLNE